MTILVGGCALFGDEMPPRKLGGVMLAMTGIVWFSWLQMGGGGSGGSGGRCAFSPAWIAELRAAGRLRRGWPTPHRQLGGAC